MIPNLQRLSLALVLLIASPLPAEVKLLPPFTDHMVLQRGAATPVFGTADPGEPVVVSFNGQTKAAAADEQGRWRVELALPDAGGPFELSVSGKDGTVRFTDVLVGEVWVCGGQSNMEWVLRGAKDGEEHARQGANNKIRLFQVKKRIATEPPPAVEGEWVPCETAAARNFSAVGFYFGQELQRELNVPVGLISSNWGGTPAQAWTPRQALEAAALKYYVERLDQGLAEWPKHKPKWEEDVRRWEATWGPNAPRPLPTTQRVPSRPRGPIGPENPSTPTLLWNGMIRPLIPFGIRGVIWYQGESNANLAYEYRTLFPTMITAWRESWGNTAGTGKDFPFYFVQLANYMAPKPQPGDSAWAELREAQAMALGLANTGMAVTIDIGEEKDIHPRNKLDVGKRLARVALAKTYGRTDLEYAGPTYESMTVQGDKVRLKFSHAAGGIVTRDSGPVSGFAVAGADKKFVWADALIEGDTVVVSSPSVSHPVAVRYAWADNPAASLYNKAGLPAPPFRTDTWVGVTQK